MLTVFNILTHKQTSFPTSILRRRTRGLLEVVVQNDVLWRRQVLRHRPDVTSCQPVGAQDGVVAHVCPEHPLLGRGKTQKQKDRLIFFKHSKSSKAQGAHGRGLWDGGITVVL